MSPGTLKEIRDWTLIAALCLAVWLAPQAWESFRTWRDAQGVWIEMDMEKRVG